MRGRSGSSSGSAGARATTAAQACCRRSVSICATRTGESWNRVVPPWRVWLRYRSSASIRACAAVTFGPQKGATPAQVAILDAALAHFADVVAKATGRDLRDAPGAGAAGGMGFALIALLGARMRPGVELIAELRGLADALEGAELCLSGEGRIDEQTLRGKTLAGVARIARSKQVPVLAFAGSVDPAVEPELFAAGVTCFPIADAPISPDESIARAAGLLRNAAARAARSWLVASAARLRA